MLILKRGSGDVSMVDGSYFGATGHSGSGRYQEIGHREAKGFECEPEQESHVLSPWLSYLKRFFHMYFFIGSIYMIQGSI
jgi:hypothetical protein